MEPIVLVELVAPDLTPGRRLVLIDHSMPEEGLSETRRLRVERQVYPGGDQVEAQLLGLDDEDITLEGHLRDEWDSPGFADAARKALLDLQASGHALQLSWGERWSRLVHLTHVQITHARGGAQGAMRYKLTCAHAELAEVRSVTPVAVDPQEVLRGLDQVGEQVTVLELLRRAVGL